MSSSSTVSDPSATSIAKLLEARPMRRAVVLGANGTMGYQSGALFAGAGVEVVFLARTREKAEQGRAGAAKAVRSQAIAQKIAVGSYDELDGAVANADLIFEAVAERLDVKSELFERVDQHRREDAIVATVTSGLSISELAAPRSEAFQRHFLGLHFFNPPQVIVGTELIAGEHTDPGVVDFVEAYAEKRLGRLMVRTANTAGFAGNRIGFKVLNEAAQLAQIHGPMLVDRLIGPYTGRAMPPLATIDLVGWDVHKAIVDNVCANVEGDEAIDTVRLPDYMQELIDRGVLGSKSGGGFFRRDENRQRFVLDIATGDYRPVKEVSLPDLPFIDEIVFLHSIGEYARAMELFCQAEGAEAALARKVIAGYISYAFCRVGEATETIAGIDRIMAAGFNWAPPSALVDLIGLQRVVKMIADAGLVVPGLLQERLDRGDSAPLFHDPALSIGRYCVAR
jgi:3-hydroxyacyl-CoA dehydrogenase